MDRLGCEMRCSREGKEAWRMNDLRVSWYDGLREEMMNEGLRVEETDGVGLTTNEVLVA